MGSNFSFLLAVLPPIIFIPDELGSVDFHKEYVTLKTHPYGGGFNKWQDGDSGRYNAFQLLLC